MTAGVVGAGARAGAVLVVRNAEDAEEARVGCNRLLRLFFILGAVGGALAPADAVRLGAVGGALAPADAVEAEPLRFLAADLTGDSHDSPTPSPTHSQNATLTGDSPDSPPPSPTHSQNATLTGDSPNSTATGGNGTTPNSTATGGNGTTPNSTATFDGDKATVVADNQDANHSIANLSGDANTTSSSESADSAQSGNASLNTTPPANNTPIEGGGDDLEEKDAFFYFEQIGKISGVVIGMTAGFHICVHLLNNGCPNMVDARSAAKSTLYRNKTPLIAILFIAGGGAGLTAMVSSAYSSDDKNIDIGENIQCFFYTFLAMLALCNLGNCGLYLIQNHGPEDPTAATSTAATSSEFNANNLDDLLNELALKLDRLIQNGSLEVNRKADEATKEADKAIKKVPAAQPPPLPVAVPAGATEVEKLQIKLKNAILSVDHATHYASSVTDWHHRDKHPVSRASNHLGTAKEALQKVENLMAVRNDLGNGGLSTLVVPAAGSGAPKTPATFGKTAQDLNSILSELEAVIEVKNKIEKEITDAVSKAATAAAPKAAADAAATAGAEAAKKVAEAAEAAAKAAATKVSDAVETEKNNIAASGPTATIINEILEEVKTKLLAVADTSANEVITEKSKDIYNLIGLLENLIKTINERELKELKDKLQAKLDALKEKAALDS